MKNIKRFLSLILALVLCLAMTACASEEDKAFEAADALLAAGDYEGAIAAFSSIGRYAEISEKIYEAEMLRIEAERLNSIANAEAFFGNWINIGKDFVDISISLTLNSDGSSHMIWGEEVYDATFGCKDNIVIVDTPYMELKVEEINGITHLIAAEYNMDFVTEADYPAFALQDIEITMDNWQEYFEMKEVNSIQVNAFGEVSSVRPAIGIFLKEEYYDRVPDNYWDVDISFEVTYDEVFYKLLNCTPDDYNYDLSGQYEKEPATAPSWYELKAGNTAIGQVFENRDSDWISEESPFYNTLSCEIGIYGGGYSDGNNQYITGWTNIQISRVIGTLRLYP